MRRDKKRDLHYTRNKQHKINEQISIQFTRTSAKKLKFSYEAYADEATQTATSQQAEQSLSTKATTQRPTPPPAQQRQRLTPQGSKRKQKSSNRVNNQQDDKRQEDRFRKVAEAS